MIALDASVLVRYFAEDEPDQAALATAIIEETLSDSAPGYITLIALSELNWVLTRKYKQSNAAIADLVQRLLDARNIVVEHERLVRIALGLAEGGLTDRLIHLVASAAGSRQTLTFDKKFARIDGVELLTTAALTP